MKNSYIKTGFLFLILPIVIAWILSNFELKEAWLGYWGGILGSALGVLGAFLILKEQIKNDKTSLEVQLENDRVQNKRQQIDNTFFNLLSMHNEQITNLKDKNIFVDIENSFKKELEVNMSSEGDEFLKKNLTLIKNAAKSMIITYEEFLVRQEGNIYEEHRQIYEKRWKEEHKAILFNKPIETQEESTFDLMANVTKKILKFEEILKAQEREELGNIDYFFKHTEHQAKFEMKIDLPNDFKKLIDSLDKYYRSDDYLCLPSKKRILAIDNSINSHYSLVGSYFRLVHSITKYINDNVIEEDIKKNYISFLRSNMNQREILTIFYNAAYTTRGQDLLYELNRIAFFGNKEDIDRNRYFNKSALFWELDDVNLMLKR
ncbi:putative phage abortive infection protein [Enterococcus casseliflavus]|uniref:putative phage abortive infection protein n=1 Tax=Enterococcus casseliflavus TaxID=37734 RepID=UPI00232E72F7|nr:putative phage abortive infection protein [Enterococcus casseliflavus]MDB1690192.1 putative phage abortive infection protein [Enterococcus casseliflavus]